MDRRRSSEFHGGEGLDSRDASVE